MIRRMIFPGIPGGYTPGSPGRGEYTDIARKMGVAIRKIETLAAADRGGMILALMG